MGERDDPYAQERQALLTRLLDSVKQCQVRFGGKAELATESDSRVTCLCTTWESVLQHGMKHTNKALSTLKQVTELTGLSKMTKGMRLLDDINRMETEPAFWQYVRENLSQHELQRYQLLKHITTDAGHGRAWLRSTLNEHSLERHLHSLLANEPLMKTLYEDWAFLRDDEKSSMMPVMAAGLSSILFAISIDNEELNTIKPAAGLDLILPTAPAGKQYPPRADCEPRPVIAGNEVLPVTSVPIPEKKKISKKKKKKLAHLVSFEDESSSYSASSSSVASPLSPSSSTDPNLVPVITVGSQRSEGFTPNPIFSQQSLEKQTEAAAKADVVAVKGQLVLNSGHKRNASAGQVHDQDILKLIQNPSTFIDLSGTTSQGTNGLGPQKPSRGHKRYASEGAVSITQWKPPDNSVSITTRELEHYEAIKSGSLHSVHSVECSFSEVLEEKLSPEGSDAPHIVEDSDTSLNVPSSTSFSNNVILDATSCVSSTESVETLTQSNSGLTTAACHTSTTATTSGVVDADQSTSSVEIPQSSCEHTEQGYVTSSSLVDDLLQTNDLLHDDTKLIHSQKTLFDRVISDGKRHSLPVSSSNNNDSHKHTRNSSIDFVPVISSDVACSLSHFDSVGSSSELEESVEVAPRPHKSDSISDSYAQMVCNYKDKKTSSDVEEHPDEISEKDATSPVFSEPQTPEVDTDTLDRTSEEQTSAASFVVGSSLKTNGADISLKKGQQHTGNLVSASDVSQNSGHQRTDSSSSAGPPFTQHTRTCSSGSLGELKDRPMLMSATSTDIDAISHASSGSVEGFTSFRPSLTMTALTADGVPVEAEMVPVSGRTSEGDTTSYDSVEVPSYSEDAENAVFALALAQRGMTFSQLRTDGDGSNNPAPSAGSYEGFTREELKEAVVAMMQRKEDVEEQNRKLVYHMQEEKELIEALRAELSTLKETSVNQHEKDSDRMNALAKENELLKHQLKKYITAVQMLRNKSNTVEDIGVVVDEQPPVPPARATIDYSHEASEYEKKLIQVAEMHGELMEFNEALHKQLSIREAQLRRLRQELTDLRGPLPEGSRTLDGAHSVVSELDMLPSHPLVNIWIPSTFLQGGSDSHHLYQVYVRIQDEEWNIYRRYAEFHNLHSKLKKTYPRVASIEFPPKKAIGNKDAKFVETRRLKLQGYIRQVVNVILQSNADFAANVNKHSLTQLLPFFIDLPKPEKKSKFGRRKSSGANNGGRNASTSATAS